MGRSRQCCRETTPRPGVRVGDDSHDVSPGNLFPLPELPKPTFLGLFHENRVLCFELGATASAYFVLFPSAATLKEGVCRLGVVGKVIS